uniref:Mannosidase beta like n=1 Tax=Ficedula albicollis TaxID=59894 RepID=A0A803VQH7_FICAL
MAAELDFSPPEIPEPTFLENVLRYGLFFGAIFQLICVLAIILPVSKSHKTGHGRRSLEEWNGWASAIDFLQAKRTSHIQDFI